MRFPRKWERQLYKEWNRIIKSDVKGLSMLSYMLCDLVIKHSGIFPAVLNMKKFKDREEARRYIAFILPYISILILSSDDFDLFLSRFSYKQAERDQIKKKLRIEVFRFSFALVNKEEYFLLNMQKKMENIFQPILDFFELENDKQTVDKIGIFCTLYVEKSKNEYIDLLRNLKRRFGADTLIDEVFVHYVAVPKNHLYYTKEV